MDVNIGIILGAIVAVILIIAGLTLRTRYKLRQQVKRKWGQPPRVVRFDKEESLKKAWKTAKNFQRFDSEIDDITWNDLDMFEVFESLNATYSSVGSEALYQRLRNFNLNNRTIHQMEELIAFYQDNPKKREDIQYYFASLGKMDNNFVTSYLSDAHSKRLANLPLFVLLGSLPIIGIILLIFGNIAGLFLLTGSICANVMYYMVKKQSLEQELNSMRYLVQMLGTAKNVSRVSTPLQGLIKENYTPLKSVLIFGFSFRIKSYSEADLIFDYLNMAFMLPFISYHYVLFFIEKYNREMIQLWELLGQLEVAYAVLNFREYMPLVSRPEYETGGIVAMDSYHPLLEEAVVNPVYWKKNTLVTGSNASGKSTYVKSIAINCILAQSINTVLAKKWVMERGHVMTSMAVEDDIFEGDSYFVAEIRSIKRVLDQVKKGTRCYCFIDEILKGTNTVERISASSSIIRWLSRYDTLAFVATHDIELTEILKNYCDNVHFEEQVTKERGITFDYKVRVGKARTRNAIQLLEVMNYPEEIVYSAKREASDFDRNRMWDVFD